MFDEGQAKQTKPNSEQPVAKPDAAPTGQAGPAPGPPLASVLPPEKESKPNAHQLLPDDLTKAPKPPQAFKKHLKLLISLAAVVIILAAVGYWIWSLNTSSVIDLPEVTQIEEMQEPEAMEMEEEISPEDEMFVDTSNWLTYRNEEYGFEFKYPPEFTSNPPNQDRTLIKELSVGLLTENDGLMDLVVFVSEGQLNPDKIQSYSGIVPEDKISIITVTEKTAYMYEEEKVCPNKIILIPNDDMYLRLSFLNSCQADTESMDELRVAILSTFEKSSGIDSDGDGLSDGDEVNVWGTDPNNQDTDDDALIDYDEVYTWNTDPNNPDTDGDGFEDGEEVENGFNPYGPGKLLSEIKKRDEQRILNIKQIQTAFELYFIDNNGYPGVDGLELPISQTVLGNGTSCDGSPCLSISSDNAISNTLSGITYMGVIPSDPSGSEVPCTPESTSVCAYSLSMNDSSSYELWFYIESDVGGLKAGPLCATGNGISHTCP